MSYKNEIFRQIYWNAMAMEIGSQFRLSDAYGAGWEGLDVPARRQAAKEFKIMVCQRQISGVIFIGQDSKKTLKYKRIPTDRAE